MNRIQILISCCLSMHCISISVQCLCGQNSMNVERRKIRQPGYSKYLYIFHAHAVRKQSKSESRTAIYRQGTYGCIASRKHLVYMDSYTRTLTRQLIPPGLLNAGVCNDICLTRVRLFPEGRRVTHGDKRRCSVGAGRMPIQPSSLHC